MAPARPYGLALVVGATLLIVSPTVGAEEPPPFALPADPTLAGLIAESLAARPELGKAEALVTAERERIPQAGALADPMLQIGIQNDGFTSIEVGRMETSFISLMASQAFLWPGKRGLRQDLAALGATQAQQAVSRVRLSTEADVRRAYLELLLVRDRLGLLAQLEAIWQKSFGIARVRYEAGDGAQSDVLRAQLEQNRIKQRRFALQAAERGQVQALNRLRNHPLDEPIATPMHLRDLAALDDGPARFSVEQALARSPELAVARTATTRANQSVALAEKGNYPDLAVAAGIMFRGALPPMWLATLGGNVPIFTASKQSRAVAENRAWALAGQKDVEALQQLLRLRAAERRAAFAAAVETIELYNHGLLVQSEATADSTLSQYKVGKVTFASVLEANVGFIADQDGYLQAIAAAHRLLIAEGEVSLAATVMPSGELGGSAGMPGAGASSMGASGGGASAGQGAAVAAPAGGGSAAGM